LFITKIYLGVDFLSLICIHSVLRYSRAL